MSGVKHTPWEEVETESSVDLEGCSGWQDIADQSGRTVAIAIGWDGWRDADLDRRARLIAAAPDLLEAAQNAVEEWGMRTGDDDALLPSVEQPESIAALMRAIARARGEQSPNHSDQKEVGNG